MDSEREKFEAWARPQVRFRGSMTRAANGPYVWDDVEDAWKVWQAATASRATPPVAGAPTPKRWPFVETPGEFTHRLVEAYGDFGTMLAAVRHVLIEKPPQFVNGLTEAETSATASVSGLLGEQPPHDRGVSSPNSALIEALCEPYGWVTMWPQIGGGTKPVFWPGPKRPSYGEELDATLTSIAVYTRGAPQGLDAALANAGKVIDPLRNAAEQFLASVSDGRAVDLIDYYAEIFEEALNPGAPIGDRSCEVPSGVKDTK